MAHFRSHPGGRVSMARASATPTARQPRQSAPVTRRIARAAKVRSCSVACATASAPRLGGLAIGQSPQVRKEACPLPRVAALRRFVESAESRAQHVKARRRWAGAASGRERGRQGRHCKTTPQARSLCSRLLSCLHRCPIPGILRVMLQPVPGRWPPRHMAPRGGARHRGDEDAKVCDRAPWIAANSAARSRLTSASGRFQLVASAAAELLAVLPQIVSYPTPSHHGEPMAKFLIGGHCLETSAKIFDRRVGQPLVFDPSSPGALLKEVRVNKGCLPGAPASRGDIRMTLMRWKIFVKSPS